MTLRLRVPPADLAPDTSAPSQLLNALKGYKDELAALQSGSGIISEERFLECVSKVLCEKVSKRKKAARGSIWRCSNIFKVLWLCFLCLLAFGLLAAGFKPLSFVLHKILHARLYYILRPIRIGLVTVIPYLDTVGMDFLNTDCMMENPLLSPAEKCACFKTKYSKEIFMNSSSIPSYVTNADVQDVYFLRNLTQFEHDFTIEKFFKFPLSNGGRYPLICYQVTGEIRGIDNYDEFFNEDKISEALNGGNSWSFSWEECPNGTNSLTLHSLIPPLHPVLNISSHSTFNIGTKWSTSTHFWESFPSGTLVIVRMLLGEARFVIQPRKDECRDICSDFRDNPILKQGDAIVFDQRVWNFRSSSWSNLTFYTIQLLSTV